MLPGLRASSASQPLVLNQPISSQHRLLTRQGLSSVLSAGLRCLFNCQCHGIKRQHSAFNDWTNVIYPVSTQFPLAPLLPSNAFLHCKKAGSPWPDAGTSF